MTQAAAYQVPSHPSGLDMRTQLNVIVLALLGDNAGPTEPVATYPGMMWGDTTASRLRRRSNANDTWIDIGPLDDFLGDIRDSVASANSNADSKVSKTGDTMTGALTMGNNAAVPIYVSYAGGKPYLVGDSAIPGCGFVNSAASAWNLQIRDDGVINLRNRLNISSGGADIRGRVTIYSGAELALNGAYTMYLRYSGSAAQMEWVNNVYNAVIARLDDSGNFSVNGNGVFGNCAVQTNGNIYMPWCGQWISDTFNGKATAGAQVQWASGIAETSAWAAGSGATVVDAGAPWVVEGIRTQSGPGWCWFRIVWLRNQ